MGRGLRLLVPFVRGLAVALAGAALCAAAALADEPDRGLTYTPVYKADLKDDAVEAAVRSASLLFSYVKEPVDSSGVLFERARADRGRIVRALNALGYFAAKVTISIDGGSIDDLAHEDAVASKPPGEVIAIDVSIVAGPLFTFGVVAIAPAVGSSDEPLQVLKADVTGLFVGGPARSSAVVAANDRIVSALRAAGYPFAAIVGREAIADHNTATLDVTFRVAAGAKAVFGDVGVKGNEAVDAAFLKDLAPFAPGEPYGSAVLDDYKAELERLAVFGSVAVEEGRSLDAQGRLPITATVTERKQHAVGVSASYSTLEGAAVGGYWLHRNLWGRAEQLRIDAQASRLLSNGLNDTEYGLSATLTLPATPTRRDDLIFSAGAKRERPDAFDRDAVFAETRIRRRFDKTLRAEAAIGFTQSRETDALGTRDRSTVQLPLTIAYDTRDNILDPTRGVRITGGVVPIVNLNKGSAFAGRLDAAASTYVALDDDNVLAGRVAVGFSAAADTQDLPVDMRFFAGGGGSVRGYEYQALSPRNAVNQIAGERSLIEGSLELRSWLWDDIGVAAFVDAGAASDANAPTFDDVGVGVGLGVRYRTPVGPLRLDVALPLDPPAGDASYGVYVALGQAF